MSDHFLSRTSENEPVCVCGFSPDVMSHFMLPLPHRRIQAKAAILDHAKALNDAAAANEWEAALDALGFQLASPPAALRSPDAPFTASSETKYPRAGVRRMPSGKWLLSLWDGDKILHVIDEPEFDDRKTAFDYGWLTIGACRQSGTNLNGMEAR